jgi:hypothetical protein
MKFRDPNFFTSPLKASFSVKVETGQTIRVASTVSRGTLEVPYTIVLRSKATNTEVETKGIWVGETARDTRHTVTTIKG